MIRRIETRKETNTLVYDMKLPAGPLSHSQIDRYLNCGAMYKFQYIDKIQIIKSNRKLIIGSGIHVGLESILRQVKEGKKADIEIASRAMYTLIKDRIKNTEHLDDLGKKDLKRQLLMCDKILLYFMKEFLPEIRPTGVEEKIWVAIDDIPLVMKIDLIDNDNCVTDFKVTGKLKSKKSAENSLQLALYGAALNIFNTSFFSIKYPDINKFKSYQPEFKEVSARKTRGDYKWAENIVHSVYEGIKKEYFPKCSPDSWICNENYCDFWNICRGKIIKQNQHKQPDFMKNMIGEW